MKKLFSILVLVFVAVLLVACGNGDDPTPNGPTPNGTPTDDVLDLTESFTFRTSMWQNDATNSSGFRQVGQGAYESLIGETIHERDALPVWRRIGSLMNVTFVHAGATSGTGGAWWTAINNGSGALTGVDFAAGSADNINRQGVNGAMLNLLPFIQAGQMPHFGARLEANPALEMSLTQFLADGTPAIFLTPYFDGIDEIENMFMARVDWIWDILDADLDEAGFTWPADIRPVGTNYVPVTPAASTGFTAWPHTYTVFVADRNSDTNYRQVTKSRSVNIIDTLRGLTNPTGRDLIEAFRSYLIDVYGGSAATPGGGYALWSDVFAGVDASYDTDELIALMMVINANPEWVNRQANATLAAQGQAPIAQNIMYFQREQNDSRRLQYARGLSMFGLNGLLSRNGSNIFFDRAGELHDVRAQSYFVDAVDNGLWGLTQDGIIGDVSLDAWPAGTNIRDQLQRMSLGQGGVRRAGFLMFDFNATQTTSGNIEAAREIDADYTFRAIMPPVVNHQTQRVIDPQTFAVSGDTPIDQYFHFTESVRAARADSWGIMGHVAVNPARLQRAILIMDQMFNHDELLTVTTDGTTEVTHTETVGNVHLFGPQEYHDVDNPFLDTDGVYVPRLSEEFFNRMRTLRAGNHINFLRMELGATLAIGHIRRGSLEFQTLSDQGMFVNELNWAAFTAGTFVFQGLYANAVPLIDAGIIDFDTIAGYQFVNPFFLQAPTMLPMTSADATIVADAPFLEFSIQNAAFMHSLINSGYRANSNVSMQGGGFITFARTEAGGSLAHIEAIRRGWARAQQIDVA